MWNTQNYYLIFVINVTVTVTVPFDFSLTMLNAQ